MPIDESAVKMVYKIRSLRLTTRVKITNRCLLLAMIGVFLMVIDTEICGQQLFGINKVSLYDIFSNISFLYLTKFRYIIV